MSTTESEKSSSSGKVDLDSRTENFKECIGDKDGKYVDCDSDPKFGDPCSSGESPVLVTPDKIIEAKRLIESGVVRTPCTKSRLSDQVGSELYFKREQMQFTGSFKDRGALNAILRLTKDQRDAGVITTSAGNHSQSMAYQCRKLKIPVTVVMPKTTPHIKVESCRKLGGNVVLHGNRFDEAKTHAMELRNTNKLIYIDGFDHPDVIAGQGTIGLEIMEDVPDADYVIVQIGGGGLIAGVSVVVKHVNSKVKIIGVESERCPGWHTACKAGKPTKCHQTMQGATQSLCEGLNVIRVGFNAFASANIDRLIAVPERYLPSAILHILEGEKTVVEGAGAAGYAALLTGKLPELRNKKVVCILSGGNIDANVLNEVISRGLVNDGRVSMFTVNLPDRPGEMAKLLKKLADLNVNVKEIHQERAFMSSHVYMTSVSCTIGTCDKNHLFEVRSDLLNYFPDKITWKKESMP